MFSVSQIITGTALKKAYDAYYGHVLGAYLESQPRERKEHKKYKIIKDLPDKTAYLDMKVKQFTTTVDALIEDAFTIVEELGQEMHDCYENMPESLQGSDVGQRRQEAADALSNISAPGVLDSANEITVVFFPSLDTGSRTKRAEEAADMLNSAAGAIREYIDNMEEKLEEEETQGNREDKGEAVDSDELNSLADELENASEEISGIEFPSMYG